MTFGYEHMAHKVGAVGLKIVMPRYCGYSILSLADSLMSLLRVADVL